MPREAIAHIRKRPLRPDIPCAFCGECWTTGKVWHDPWVVELELEERTPE